MSIWSFIWFRFLWFFCRFSSRYLRFILWLYFSRFRRRYLRFILWLYFWTFYESSFTNFSGCFCGCSSCKRCATSKRSGNRSGNIDGRIFSCARIITFQCFFTCTIKRNCNIGYVICRR